MASRLLPASWFSWSDGSDMTSEVRASMKRVMRKTSLRVAGETTRERFVRVRAVIEAGLRRRAAERLNGKMKIENGPPNPLTGAVG